MRKLIGSLSVCLLFVFSACSDSDQPHAAQDSGGTPQSQAAVSDGNGRQSFVLGNLNLFDGVELQQNKLVVVVDGEIAAIEDAGDTDDRWSDLQRVDGAIRRSTVAGSRRPAGSSSSTTCAGFPRAGSGPEI